MGIRKTDPIPEPPTPPVRDLWAEMAVRAMDEAQEPLCVQCGASFPVKGGDRCADCLYVEEA